MNDNDHELMASARNFQVTDAAWHLLIEVLGEGIDLELLPHGPDEEATA